MKLIIAGGRDFEDKVLAVNSFMALIAEVNYTLTPTVTKTNTITEQHNDTKSIVVRENPFTEIVISHTEGVESTRYSRIGDCHVGEFLVNFYRIPVKRFIPYLDTLGIESIYLRNAEMAEYADALLAFWDKKSKSMEHMIKIAKQKGLIVKVVYY